MEDMSSPLDEWLHTRLLARGHVRGSASFRPPRATPTAGSPRSTRRSRVGTASRAASGSSAHPTTGRAAGRAGRRLRLRREHCERACAVATARRSTARCATRGTGRRLGGVSAGANCWFEAASRTRSDRTSRRSRTASHSCPEASARTTTAKSPAPRLPVLVDEGFTPGYAADDGAAIHFVGTELREVVTRARMRTHTASKLARDADRHASVRGHSRLRTL